MKFCTKDGNPACHLYRYISAQSCEQVQYGVPRRGAFFVHCQGTKASGHFNTMTPAGTNKSITFTRVFIPTSKRRVMTHDTVSIVIIYHLPRVEGYTARWPRIAPANPIHQFVARILLPPESPEAGWSLASASQEEACREN